MTHTDRVLDSRSMWKDLRKNWKW